MQDDFDQIALAAARLVKQLPHSLVVVLIEAINAHAARPWAIARSGIVQSLPTPEFREAAQQFLDHWYEQARGISFQSAAVALKTAAKTQELHQGEEAIEIVWTGPETTLMHFRQTEQAILEVLNSAVQRLTVVSYAVYEIPRIRDALINAANRGVSIRIIVETPNWIEGKGEYDCIEALGKQVQSRCAVYYWPEAKRIKDDKGKVGSLHVKCAVADGKRLFLSSANLTEYAFTMNMELGLLVTGGKLPGQVERQFVELIERGELVQVRMDPE